MTPQELKNSILQLAIQGKLVEQRAEEGTAAELVEKILATKNAKGAKKDLTRSRGARGEKETSALSASPREKIPDDEKPFDIPESWEWVRLGEVASMFGGNTPSMSDMATHGIPYFKVAEMNLPGNEKYLSITKLFVRENATLRRFPAATIVFPKNGGALLTNKKRILLQPSVCDLNTGGICLHDISLLDYVYWWFISIDLGKYHTGSALPTINRKTVENLPIPLPPLAEQKRIVAKIEELLPLIDRYEKAWSKLEDFNKRFPVDMQKSLFQMAIQGKLVEQRPEEGTAAELLEKILAAKNAKDAKKNLTQSRGARGEKSTSALSASPREVIPDDEIPFEIPESWEWVRLSSVTDMLSGFAFKSTDFKANGKYRLLRGINLGVDDVRWKETVYVDYITERMAEYRLKSGDVLIGLDRPWISDGTRVAIFNDSKETYLVQRVLRLRETGLLTSAFIALLLRSSLLSNSIGDKTTGISVPHISPGQVGNLLIPLPPLAEQKRIVAKLEELLPLCERLKLLEEENDKKSGFTSQVKEMSKITLELI